MDAKIAGTLTVVRAGAGRLVAGATVGWVCFDLLSSSCTLAGGAAGVTRKCLGGGPRYLCSVVVGIGGSLVFLGCPAMRQGGSKHMAIGIVEVVLVSTVDLVLLM